MTANPQAQAQLLIAQAKQALQRHAAGDLKGAEADYRRVVGRVDHLGLHQGFGTLLATTGRAVEALPWLRRVAVQVPDRAAALGALAVALRESGDLDAAGTWLHRQLVLDPANADGHANLGVVLTARGEADAAAESLRTACRYAPANADYRHNLAIADEKRGDHVARRTGLRRALALQPDHRGALINGAHCAVQLGLSREALTLYRHLTALEPADAVHRFRRGGLRIAAGDWCNGESAAEWAGGWADYEARYDIPAMAPISPAAPDGGPLSRWDGHPLPGGTLLITAEEGFGDLLMFWRFVAMAQVRVGRLVVQVPPPLVPLLKGQIPGVELIWTKGRIKADATLPVMSLPYVLRVTPDALPQPPYLRVPSEAVAPWRDRLAVGNPNDERRHFGLVWAGNPAFALDRHRSPGLRPLLALLDVPDWRPVCLQVGPGRGDLDTFPWPEGAPDWGREFGNFADTAAAIAALDLVITSDTSVVHLAGALGVETWLIRGLQTDWRWTCDPAGRPHWYPDVQVFAQRTLGDWTDVAARIKHALSKRTT